MKKSNFVIQTRELFNIIFRYFKEFNKLIPIYLILGIFSIFKSILMQEIFKNLGRISSELNKIEKDISIKIAIKVLIYIILYAIITCFINISLNFISSRTYTNITIKQINFILNLERIKFINQTSSDYLFNINRCSKGLSDFLQYIITSYLGAITTVYATLRTFIKLFGNKNTFYFFIIIIFHFIINYNFISWMIKYRYLENEKLNLAQKLLLEKINNRDLIIMTDNINNTLFQSKINFKKYESKHIKTEYISPILEFITFILFYGSGLGFIIYNLRKLNKENITKVETFVVGFLSLQNIYSSLLCLGFMYQFTCLVSVNIKDGYIKKIKKKNFKEKLINKIENISIINYSKYQLNFSINFNNKKIAIIGPNGSGKTYFIECLLGFHNGIINQLVNEIPFNLINKESFYSNISYCSSEIKLFNGTIIENMIYGTKKTYNDILNICKKLGFYKHFSKLINGFEMKLGDNFENISNGEKQMINIVRTLSKDANIYIFDEPSNYLEIKKTKMFLEFISLFLFNKSIIIISQDKYILNNFKRNFNLKIFNRKIKCFYYNK